MVVLVGPLCTTLGTTLGTEDVFNIAREEGTLPVHQVGFALCTVGILVPLLGFLWFLKPGKPLTGKPHTYVCDLPRPRAFSNAGCGSGSCRS